MTFSIIAKDKKTGRIGAGMCTHWFGSTKTVLWGKSGVGIVASQALTNKCYGPKGLKLLEEGYTPKDAIEKLTTEDKLRENRQVSVIDKNGNYYNFSGKKSFEEILVYKGENFCIQANLMANKSIANAIGESFEKAKKILPNNVEIKFWKAILMINSGNKTEGVKILEDIFKDGGSNWKKLANIIIKRGELKIENYF